MITSERKLLRAEGTALLRLAQRRVNLWDGEDSLLLEGAAHGGNDDVRAAGCRFGVVIPQVGQMGEQERAFGAPGPGRDLQESLAAVAVAQVELQLEAEQHV